MKPHRGTMILVFGILGLLFCQIFGAIAWIMGNADLREMRAGRMDPEGESLTNVGRILGIVSIVLLLGMLVIVCLVSLFMAAGLGVAGGVG